MLRGEAVGRLSYLYNSMHEGHSVENGSPLWHVRDVQEVLSDPGVGPLQPSLDALWGLIGELNRHL